MFALTLSVDHVKCTVVMAYLAWHVIACSMYIMQTNDCLITVGVMLQDVADSVDLSSHEDSQAEAQASLQLGADARQLIMEAVTHLQVMHTVTVTKWQNLSFH